MVEESAAAEFYLNDQRGKKERNILEFSPLSLFMNSALQCYFSARAAAINSSARAAVVVVILAKAIDCYSTSDLYGNFVIGKLDQILCNWLKLSHSMLKKIFKIQIINEKVNQRNRNSCRIGNIANQIEYVKRT